MPAKVAQIMEWIEELAPKRLAEDWDNVGLLVGDPRTDVQHVLVSVDCTETVVDEAVSLGAELIVSHHPLLFRPIKSLRADLPAGELLARMMTHGVAAYAAHTNLDICSGGINDWLGRQLDLTDTEVLLVTSRETLTKLVVYVPLTHLEIVRQAICTAGAGWIGQYSHCTFSTSGEGTFLPLEGTAPFIGDIGRQERVEEARLETIVAEGHLRRVLRAMNSAHPYEEVAYDLLELKNEGRETGLGRVGRLPEAVELGTLADQLKMRLSLDHVLVTGEECSPIRKIAICSGAGSSVLGRACAVGADLLVTGEIDHHRLLEAVQAGLAVVQLGHWSSERCATQLFAELIQRKGKDTGKSMQVTMATSEREPWTVR